MSRRNSNKCKSIAQPNGFRNQNHEALLAIEETMGRSKRNSNPNIINPMSLQDEHYLYPEFKGKYCSKEINKKVGSHSIKIGKASNEYTSFQSIEEGKQCANNFEENSLNTSQESIFSSRHPSKNNLMVHNDKKSNYLSVINENKGLNKNSHRMLRRSKKGEDFKENFITDGIQNLLTTETKTLKLLGPNNKTKVRSLNLIHSKKSSMIDQPIPEVIKKDLVARDLKVHNVSFEVEGPHLLSKGDFLIDDERKLCYLKRLDQANNNHNAPTKNQTRKYLTSGRRLIDNQSSKRILTEDPKSILETDPDIQKPQTLNSFINDNYHDSSVNLTINEITQDILQAETAKRRIIKKTKGKSYLVDNQNAGNNHHHAILKENNFVPKTDSKNLSQVTKNLNVPLRPTSNNANRFGSHSIGSSLSRCQNLGQPINTGHESLIKRFNDIVSHSTKPSISKQQSGLLKGYEKDNKSRRAITTKIDSKSNVSTRANSKTGEAIASQMNTDDKIKLLKNKIKDCENLRKRRKNIHYRENESPFGQTNLRFTPANENEEKDLEEDFKKKLLISRKVQLYDLLIQQKLVGKKLSKDALRQVKTEFSKVSAGLEELKLQEFLH